MRLPGLMCDEGSRLLKETFVTVTTGTGISGSNTEQRTDSETAGAPLPLRGTPPTARDPSHCAGPLPLRGTP
ncbi:hypothetical protein LEMLEM_LOCUS13798, partial [Lemmus lemmus]